MFNNELIFALVPFILLNLTLFIYRKKLFSFMNILDDADGIRKIHSGKVPSVGGVIIILNIILLFILKIFNLNFSSILFLGYFGSLKHVVSFFLISILVFFLGLYDDKYGIKPLQKLLGIIIILLGAVFLDSQLILENIKFSFHDKIFYLDNFSIFFTILCITLFINAMNMFDGMNMLAGLYALTIFISFLFIGYMPLISLIIISSLILFLIFNFNGKLFLGDNGSLLLGYLISYYFIKIYNEELILHSDKIFLFMIFPGLDLLRLSVQRLLIGRNPFSPDRNHIHHLLKRKYGDSNTIIILISFILTPIILSNFIDVLYCNFIGFLFYVLSYYLGIKKVV